MMQENKGRDERRDFTQTTGTNNGVESLECGVPITLCRYQQVTWVEHMEVEESLPNQTFYDHLIRSGFAFGAERMVAWLERSCERGALVNATSDMNTKAPGFEGKEAPWITEKLTFMEFGEYCMVRFLFENISPNDDFNRTLWRSVTGPEDLKVHATLYKSFANFEVAGGVVAFHVKHSPEFVLETLGDERIHHEWDVLGGLRKIYTFKQYSTGSDTRNHISASKWCGPLFQRKILISSAMAISEDSVLVSGFSISTDGHTTATNKGGSVITLVLRMLVDGNLPLQEKRQQSIELITFAINQTVGRVKEALEKPRPPSPPRGDWQQVVAYNIASEDWQQVGAYDGASEILQNELRVLKLN
ncbi:hypothetical protein CTI12_AA186670 [Artemisia annua]|uniref:START domain-containing protein n=1 Tax=Artemisia annua TaxID=35608 RepID=A0A2U1P754_ARTAN|nr:hypothetical protein CTI12_AA186670 [Artemisia annua]